MTVVMVDIRREEGNEGGKCDITTTPTSITRGKFRVVVVLRKERSVLGRKRRNLLEITVLSSINYIPLVIQINMQIIICIYIFFIISHSLTFIYFYSLL